MFVEYVSSQMGGHYQCRLQLLFGLLEAAHAGPDNLGMAGYERALLYRVAAETGLRANELRSLNKLSFDFEGCTVTVKVGSTKNSKKDVLLLKEETAAALQQFLAGKMPGNCNRD